MKESKCAKKLDDEFIPGAKFVYFENDINAELKKSINLKFDSSLIEKNTYNIKENLW